MGKIAEMMLDGTLCEKCGAVLGGESPGYPRYCKGCNPDNKPEKKRKKSRYVNKSKGARR